MQSMWMVASPTPSALPAMRVGNLAPSVVPADALAGVDDDMPEGIKRVPALHPLSNKGARSDVERHPKRAELV